MTINTLTTGDTIRLVTISGGSWGSAPTVTVSPSDIDCRIDVNGGSEDRQAGRADRMRAMMGYFLTNPGLSVGKYIRWTATGGVAFATNIYMRVVNFYPEGKPGQTPRYWVADLQEVTAADLVGVGE